MIERFQQLEGRINHTNPEQLLIDLGLTDQTRWPMERKELERKPFSWVNMATQDIPMGPALEAIRRSDLVNPPRTGHMGGLWRRIVRGGGGPLVLNQIIRQEKFGYPLIFDQNQIPTIDDNQGDTLYYPGTVFRDDEEFTLALYTIDGNPVDRRQPLYAPLMMVDIEDQHVSLPAFHQEEIKKLMPEAVFLSQRITEQEDWVRELLNQMLNQAEKEDDFATKSQLLRLVADRVILPDGRVLNCPLSHRGGAYYLNGQNYSREEIINRLMIPFLYTADPDKYRLYLPDQMLRISKEMLIILMAVLNTDFYSGKQSLFPVNPHLHWGAFQMAGAPPKKDGYFSGSVNGLRILMSVIRAEMESLIPPVYYILMPASIFTLWPSAADQVGQEMMAELIEMVHKESDSYKGKPNKILEAIEKVVTDWYDMRKEGLPDYLRARFSSYDDSRTKAMPPSDQFIKPEGFDDLTFRQASIMVGSLLEVVK